MDDESCEVVRVGDISQLSFKTGDLAFQIRCAAGERKFSSSFSFIIFVTRLTSLSSSYFWTLIGRR
jgi:hypothetical protein